MTLDFDRARRVVREVARRTPLLPAVDASERVGRRVLLKAECLQATGSFKVRGAAARLAELDAAERARGVVACSSGNHGRAVAWVAGRTGVPATIYLPEWVDPVKLAAIRASGAEAVLAGATFDEAEGAAIAEAERSGRAYVSAYDDPWVIAGQGTIALEVLEQCEEEPAAVLVPLSGGGLAGGIAAALHERRGTGAAPTVAVSARNAAVMVASLEAGHPVDLPERETLAGALAGGIGLGNRHSFALVRDRVAEHVVVDEGDIASAMRYAATRLHLVVEGGGAVALAALLGGLWSPPLDRRGPIVVVLSGGNVAPATLARLLRG